MTDARTRRTATLAAAAQAKSQIKMQAAEQALGTLIKRGEPVTFQAVQREAGVSHASSTTIPTCAGASSAYEPRPARLPHRLLRPDGATPSSSP